MRWLRDEKEWSILGRTFGQSGKTSSRLAKYTGARSADDDGLGVREHGGDGKAS